MDKKDEAFLKRLLATFKVEAAEHIAAIASGLLDLEKVPADGSFEELTETVFREIHSLKGAARSVNIREIESLCQSLEGVFSVLKIGDVELAPAFFGIVHRSLNTLDDLLSAVDEEGKVRDKNLNKGLIAELTGLAEELEKRVKTVAYKKGPRTADSGEKALPEPPPSVHKLTSETIRVTKAKLDSVLLQAEGLLHAKQTLGQRTSELKGISAEIGKIEKIWTKARRDMRLLEKDGRPEGKPSMHAQTARLLEFLEAGRDQIRVLQRGLNILEKKMEGDHRTVGSMVNGLLDSTKRISMMPFSALFDILPITVRDLLSAQGKEAELAVAGGDIEVDRRILEEMKDPLIHLMRNCVDHGIERPRERAAKGKPPVGKISVSVSHQDSAKVELLVADDGTGIDASRVRASAVRLGIISAEDADRLDKERLRALIFRSGVSTSQLITDISGRGLGLAIVQEKVEKLGGTVSCESSLEAGTAFRVALPLSLATLRGLLILIEGLLVAVPVSNVKRTMRFGNEDIKTVEGRETVLLDGSALPLVHLGGVLELPAVKAVARRQGDSSYYQAVVLGSEDKVMAFRIDEVLHEQEFLVKGLGRQLRRVRNVLGAAVLGTGSVVPVLNVPDLLKSAVRTTETLMPHVLPAPVSQEKKSVLVVEDSITARTLLRNILETSGFYVKTAVDGTDAYGLLKTEAFDLVVSDVDMPRMNGFELTLKIRQDKKLADLPVVLVTALDSRDDRERGIDVGANAYIVKSSFDQSNLLEVIKRLI